jgi:hypothetical protein
MKINKLFIGLLGGAIGVLTSCENQDVSYSDFKYQTVYFANQYPARTVELGKDLYVDNTIDKAHKVIIKATTGGVYSNKKNIVISIEIDSSLLKNADTTNLFFASQATKGSKVVPMPLSYYSLASNQITIPSGSLLGGVEVTLNDAFFADPKSLKNTYAIPLVMTNVTNADSILQGTAGVDDPDRCTSSDWSVVPLDYVLYVVKFVNTWHGYYLRRGADQITPTSTGITTTANRHETYVEDNDTIKLITTGLMTNKVYMPVSSGSLITVPYFLYLTFSSDGTCTISSGSSDFTISGTGKYVTDGDENSIGGIDRDALYLDYSVNYKNIVTYATKDTLALRDRAVAPEYYTVSRTK